MTEREAMMRCIEVIGSSGIREPQKLLRDAKELHKVVMECDDGDTPKRRPRGAAE